MQPRNEPPHHNRIRKFQIGPPAPPSPNSSEMEALLLALYTAADAAVAAGDEDHDVNEFGFLVGTTWNLQAAISHLESTLAPFKGMRRGES